MFKRTILALSVAALTITGVAQAQENVTLTMRSGEKINALLVDLGGNGFAIRVNGQDRNIPANDVSVIDFGGTSLTDADWTKVNDGQPVIWLRNGEVINGSLYDIGGTNPLKLTIRTNNGERELSSNEVGHIILSRPTNAVATTGVTTNNGPGISVPANQQWTSTGVTVRKGEVITFNTTGEVQLSTDASDIATASGAKSGRRIANGPLPNGLAGALVGRIGNNGAPFGIGTATSVPMPATGVLFLGVNDDGMGDNVGEFRVQILRNGTVIR